MSSFLFYFILQIFNLLIIRRNGIFRKKKLKKLAKKHLFEITLATLQREGLLDYFGIHIIFLFLRITSGHLYIDHQSKLQSLISTAHIRQHYNTICNTVRYEIIDSSISASIKARFVLGPAIYFKHFYA